MKDFDLPEQISDKIYEIKTDGVSASRIVSYFPLSDTEKKKIREIIENENMEFRSIFSDIISDEKWVKSKKQIKKRFQDELFDID